MPHTIRNFSNFTNFEPRSKLEKYYIIKVHKFPIHEKKNTFIHVHRKIRPISLIIPLGTGIFRIISFTFGIPYGLRCSETRTRRHRGSTFDPDICGLRSQFACRTLVAEDDDSLWGIIEKRGSFLAPKTHFCVRFTSGFRCKCTVWLVLFRNGPGLNWVFICWGWLN